MDAYKANLLNSATLIVCSLWAFLTLDKTSYTALIPAGFGVALALCGLGLRPVRFWVAGLATVLSLIILVALYVPLMSALEPPISLGFIRVVAMMLTSLLSVFCLTKLLSARFFQRAG